jgi:hypothetical protein
MAQQQCQVCGAVLNNPNSSAHRNSQKHLAAEYRMMQHTGGQHSSDQGGGYYQQGYPDYSNLGMPLPKRAEPYPMGTVPPTQYDDDDDDEEYQYEDDHYPEGEGDAEYDE